MPQVQTWDPQRYARNARFVSDLGSPVVELLAPREGERILDLGCGDGALTEKLVAFGCQVLGVDASEAQVAAAVARGIDAQALDGETLTFHEEFDAVFSNAAMHWMRNADAVIDGVWHALRPGGRFVAEMGGAGCVGTIRTALVEALNRRGIDGASADPWYFPSAEEYRARLEHRGFAVRYAALIPRPTSLPGDMVSWLETFAESFTNPLPPEQREEFRLEVQATLRPQLCSKDGNWTADYVRLRFAADKPV